MDGSSRRVLPPVVRSFAPARLAEELVAGAYERLLATQKRRAGRPPAGRCGAASGGGDQAPPSEVEEALAAGGRS